MPHVPPAGCRYSGVTVGVVEAEDEKIRRATARRKAPPDRAFYGVAKFLAPMSPWR